jgi:hypothetical protein
VSKPALPLPPGLRTLLQRLEQDRPPDYLQMSISLLDLPRSTWPRIAAAWSYVNTDRDHQRRVLVVDPAFAFGNGSTQGFTFMRWDDELQDPDTMTMLLTRYCTVQKHRARAKLWYGLLISTSTASASAVVAQGRNGCSTSNYDEAARLVERNARDYSVPSAWYLRRHA